jgi:multidrug resistance efflux pump
VKKTLGMALLLGSAGAAIGIGLKTGTIPNPLARGAKLQAAAPTNGDRTPTVKVVSPRREAAVPITIDQIATIEPYYRADLRARASGIVKSVRRDIGDAVKAGEVLIEIDVPESVSDVARAEAMIVQREQELKVSDAKLKDAKAARDVSAATIRQRQADVAAATATRDLKKRKFERYRELAGRGSVVGSVAEEEERDYLASEASVASAQANVERAKADFAESESKIEAAAADTDLKRAQIEVAKKERDRAAVVADYGKVVAPFDGTVIRRAVDPGSFVQNATTGASEVLIAVAKTDLVTVTAKVPDAVAPSVAVGMPALVTVDDLPGVSIAATVTRFSPSVQSSDHTMRVEVDLFNGDEAAYARLAADATRARKGAADPMPVRAFPADTPAHRRLLPGMSGTIRLTTGGFGESFVLPNTAVYSRSGTSYVLLVEDGKTKQVPVRVQVSDGKTVRVAVLETRVAATGRRDVLTELTGRERVVIARQLEIGDGATVTVGPTEW